MEYLTGVVVEAEEENVAVDVVVASAFEAVVVVVEVADDGIKVTLVVVITLVSVDESTLAARLGDSVNRDVGSEEEEEESRVTGVESGRGPTSLEAEFLIA